MHVVVAPWQHAFMQHAVLELALVAVLAGVLGCWVVLYGLSYSAESLAHGMLPGLVAASVLGLPILAGAAVGIGAAALGVALTATIATIGRDTAVAIAVTALFGLGVLLALAPASPPGIQTILFGDPLAVTTSDLVTTLVLCAVALTALVVLHRALLATGFDRTSAPALGLSPFRIELALLGLLAVAILVGVQALGNLLVVAVLVAPAATARLLTHRLRPMMGIAVAIGAAGAVCGLYLSYYAGLAAGASIALVLVAAYVVAVAGDALVRRVRVVPEQP
jgi:ABC-type Mn2+/Zn2+ transport system permease subunit